MVPRGYRNNNPLNIEDGPFARSIPGYAGSDGRFARFNAFGDGETAADQLLQVYGRKHGINTINGVINRWAPPSDGNDVGSYSNFVAQAMGFAPDQSFDMADPEKRTALARAMADFENGKGTRPNASSVQRTDSLKTEVTPTADAPMSMPAAAGGGGGDPWSQIGRSLVGAGSALASATNPEGSAAMARLYAQMGDSDGAYSIHFDPTSGQLFRLDKKTGAITSTQGAKPKPQPTEYDKADAKAWSDRNQELIASGQKARDRLQTVQQMRQLVDHPDVVQGAIGPVTNTFKNIANSLGFKVDGLAETQYLDALAKQGALMLRDPSTGAGMPGALSDADRKFLEQASVSLGNSREGNKLLIDYMERLHKRAIEVDQWREEYIAKNGRLDNGFSKVVRERANAAPLFANEQQNKPAVNKTSSGITWSVQ